MSVVKLNFDETGLGAVNKIEVDGVDMSHMVSDVTMHFSAGCVGTIQLDLLVSGCEISAEGIVEINSQVITDEIGYQIYKQLQEHYEEEKTDG